jgi:6-phosphofructokinase
VKRIAVLTSGGDAPGMNAAIRAARETRRRAIRSGLTPRMAERDGARCR